MNLTRAGISLTLEDSPYYFCLDGVTFYFSSKRYLEKFMQNYKTNREEINSKLTQRYKFSIKLNKLADIYLYIQIEKRGFYIVDNAGECFRWQPCVNWQNGQVILLLQFLEFSLVIPLYQ